MRRKSRWASLRLYQLKAVPPRRCRERPPRLPGVPPVPLLRLGAPLLDLDFDEGGSVQMRGGGLAIVSDLLMSWNVCEPNTWRGHSCLPRRDSSRRFSEWSEKSRGHTICPNLSPSQRSESPWRCEALLDGLFLENVHDAGDFSQVVKAVRAQRSSTW